MANFNYNKVILGGRFTSDPELKTTAGGTMFTSFTLAVNSKYRNSFGESKTHFINCIAWKQNAEFIARYFKKASCVLVEGELQTRQWEDAFGQKRYGTEVLVNEATFVDSKREMEERLARKIAAGDNEPDVPLAEADENIIFEAEMDIPDIPTDDVELEF